MLLLEQSPLSSLMDSEVFTEADNVTHPVGPSRSGRRRRMLTMLVASNFDGPIADEPVSSDPPSGETQTEYAEDTASQTPDSHQQTAVTAGDAERIHELLDDIQPRTWVFTGDNLGFEIQQARRGWVEHFSDFVHERLGRKHDIILNSSLADSTISRLFEDLEWRILRFHPDVVLIMPGANECAANVDLDAFQETLQLIVECLHDEGCAVVLCTPPCPTAVNQKVKATLKAATLRIRLVATQTGAVLADHFSHWKATLNRDGANANLHDESGQQPSAKGHRELARRLLKSLNVRSS
jgi:lysophospholipase L1-like esterase